MNVLTLGESEKASSVIFIDPLTTRAITYMYKHILTQDLIT